MRPDIKNIDIIYYCNPEPGLLKELKAALKNTWGLKCSSKKVGRKHFASAFDKSRNKWNSTKILNLIPQNTLAIADVDLFARDLSFVFGEAFPNANKAVISLMRLRPQFYGFTKNMKLFQERAAKEAVHEVGHLLACLIALTQNAPCSSRKPSRIQTAKGLAFAKLALQN